MNRVKNNSFLSFFSGEESKMKISELVKKLNEAESNGFADVFIASDEELNNIFSGIGFTNFDDPKKLILYPEDDTYVTHEFY